MADKAQFQEAVKRGSAFAWRGQWADAAREYRQSLALFPDDASALNYLAMALFKSGQLEEALECYRRVWKTQPANLSALQKVAEVQDAMGDKDSAIASYRQISDQQLRRNFPDEALKALQKVVELRPTEAESWSALMSVAALAGNLGDMIPRSLTLARELFLKDRFQDAFRVAEQVQSIDPTNLAVPRLIAAFRKGLEYSYRTAAAGDDIHRGDMAQLIPPVEQLEQAEYAAPDLPAPRTALAAPAPHPQPVVPPAFVAPRPPEYLKPREPRTEAYARHPAPQPLAAASGDEPPSVLPLEEISEVLFPQLKLVREMALDAKFKEAFVAAERAQKEYPDNRAVAAMIAALRKGLEYVYARVATGREIVAEDIARLIPFVPEPPGPLAPETPVPVALELEAQSPEPEPQPEPETWGSMPGATFCRSIEDLPSAVPSKDEPAQLQHPVVEAAQGKSLPDGERALEAEATAPHETSGETEESAPPAPADGSVGAFAEIGEADAPGAAVPPIPVETEMDVPDSAESGVEDPTPEEALAREPVAETEEEPLLEETRDHPEALGAEAPAAPAALHAEETGPVDEAGVEANAIPTGQETGSSAPEEAPVASVEASPGTARDEEPAAAGGEPPNAAEPSSPAPNTPPKPAKGLPWRQRLAEAWTQMSLKDEEEDEEEEEGDAEAETLAPAAPSSDLPTLEPSVPPKEAALTGQSLDGAVSLEADVASLELERAAAGDTGIPSTSDLAGEQPALALDTEAGGDAAPESLSEPLVPTIPGFAAIEVMAGSIQPSPDSGSTRLLLQLAEDHLRLGRVPQAAAAYEELLSAFPDNLQGVLGLGRARLTLEQYDEAEATARRAVALSAPAPDDDEWPAGRLVLEIARERVARGDVVSAAAAFAWLRRATSSVALSPHLAELLATEPVELLGETIGNHLEEISQLSVGEAERTVPALWRAEKLLGERLLRSAADELYELLEEFPSFLPVQSLLGRVLLADGREDEAREKSRRLLELYEIRGTPDQGLEVLWWTVALGLAGEEDRATLVRLLRDGHRDRDADWIEKSRWGGNLRPAGDAQMATVAVIGEPGEGVPPASATAGENGASRAAGYQPAGRNGSGREEHAEDPLATEQLSSDNEGDAGGFDAADPGLGDRPQGWEALLATAEDRYSRGDLEGAAGIIRSALADCPEDATGSRAALTRMLKVVDRLDGEGNDLAESLRRLGLSEELAD